MRQPTRELHYHIVIETPGTVGMLPAQAPDELARSYRAIIDAIEAGGWHAAAWSGMEDDCNKSAVLTRTGSLGETDERARVSMSRCLADHDAEWAGSQS